MSAPMAVQRRSAPLLIFDFNLAKAVAVLAIGLFGLTMAVQTISVRFGTRRREMAGQQFHYSRLKLGGMTFALVAILVAPGVLCIVDSRDDAPFDRACLAVVSTALFLLGALIVRKFYKVCVDGKPVVTITNEGIFDTRVSKDMIVWSDIKGVQFSGGRDRTIHLRLIPGARKRLHLKKKAAIYTALLGVVGIAPGPLAVRDSKLLRAIESQMERRRAAAGVADITSPRPTLGQF
jgi:hypothetical protein